MSIAALWATRRLDTLEREGFVQTGTRIATHRELIIELQR
jgi:hypothetical protein